MATKEELESSIETLSTGITGISDGLADLATDFDAAVKKLQDQIAAGQVDLGPSVAALVALSEKTTQIADAIKSLDAKAEEISGQPTPPPEPPAA